MTQRIHLINMNMLENDEVWNIVNEDIKIDTSEDSFTHESNINKRIQQIRL